jgi:hypothetical protein
VGSPELNPQQQKTTNMYMKKMFSVTCHREIQIKITMRYHLTLVRMAIIQKSNTSVGEDVWKLKLICSVDGNGKWYSLYGNASKKN